MPEAEAPRRWKMGLWWRTSPAPLPSPGTALTCTPRAGPWRPGSQAPGGRGGGRLAHPHFSSTLLPPVSLPHLPLGAPRINNQIKCLYSNSCLQVFCWRNTNRTAHLSREENKCRGTECLAQEIELFCCFHINTWNFYRTLSPLSFPSKNSEAKYN